METCAGFVSFHALFSYSSIPITWKGQHACQTFQHYIVKVTYILYLFVTLLFQKVSADRISFNSRNDRCK